MVDAVDAGKILFPQTDNHQHHSTTTTRVTVIFLLLSAFTDVRVVSFQPSRVPTVTRTAGSSSSPFQLYNAYLDSLSARCPVQHGSSVADTASSTATTTTTFTTTFTTTGAPHSRSVRANAVDPETLAAVRQELKLFMDNPSWDDDSLAPILIRLAWHSSGTFDATTGTGGSNGAGMRFATEAADPENAGLAVARAFLEPIKKKFPSISYSDLWILAAYVGLEHTGGPVIPFTSGRADHPDESYWTANRMSYGRLPAAEKYLCPHAPADQLGNSLDNAGKIIGWENLCSHVRNEVFYRMGFNDQEIVALLCGGHVYGRCHPTFSGYAGPWVENPTRFSNEYATDMLEDEWTLVSHGDTWLDE